MRPIICLTGSIEDTGDVTLLSPYAAAIEKAGGVPFLLPYTEEEETLARVCDAVDGFFFTGGKDIAPSRYGEEMHAACGALQPKRDALEFALFARAYQTRKPILGVCRGAQLINVALGGTLYQDIPTECPSHIPHVQIEAKFEHSHRVDILNGTPLADLIGTPDMGANSFHHQSIKHLGQDLAVMARAQDGMIEAIFGTDARYLRAYQWHPERLIAISADNLSLFADFIAACNE